MVRRIALLLFAAFIISASAMVVTADVLQQVRADFLSANPNNGWKYGYVDKDGSFVAYNSTFDDGKGIAGWALDYCPELLYIWNH